MGTQAVNFEGRVYNFPSDAKDDEILSFLKDVPSPASGNLPGIPAPPTFNPHPDRSLGAKAGYVINDILQRNPDVAAEGTRRVNQLRDFARPILSTSTPGIVSGMLHKTLPGMTSPIDLKNETIPNAVLGTGLGAAEGMASEAELGVGGNRVGSSTRPAEPAPNPAQMGNVGSRAPSVPTTGPRSGSTISVSEASPLITPREGMQLGKHLLTKNPFGIIDSISSILKRHSDSTTAGEVTEQATGPRGVSVPPANSTTARPPTEVPPPVTVPHHTVQSGVWPAKSTMEWNGETASRSPAPKLERKPPAWKTNPSEGTEVPSVLGGHAAPDPRQVVFHGTDASNIQSILQKGIESSDWSKEHGLPLPDDSRLRNVGPFVGDRDVAESYARGAENQGRTHGVVFKARVPLSKLTEDRAFTNNQVDAEAEGREFPGGRGWEHNGPIPKSQIFGHSEIKPPRSEPDWKTNPAADNPTELPSVAPQVQGRLADTDVQSLLKRTGPPRGGKAQSARALMRKNIKGMVEEQNPEGEGPPSKGTGPGAMLRRGSELGAQLAPGPNTGPGIRLFHGTHESNIPSILKEGIRAGDESGREHAYTTRNKGIADWWSEGPYNHDGPKAGEGATVEVEVPKSAIRDRPTTRDAREYGSDYTTGKGMTKHSGEFEGVTSGTTISPRLIKNVSFQSNNELIDQFDRDRETRNQLDILGGTERRLPSPQREFTPPQSPPPFRRTASPLQKALYDYDKKHSPYNR